MSACRLSGWLVLELLAGIDPHKATHTAVAVDGNEVVLGEFKVSASKVQAGLLCGWADRFEEREWAVESANGLGYLVARQLVAAGETVLDVSPMLASRASAEYSSGLISAGRCGLTGRSGGLPVALRQGLRRCLGQAAGRYWLMSPAQLSELALVPDDGSVQELVAQSPNPSFGVCVCMTSSCSMHDTPAAVVRIGVVCGATSPSNCQGPAVGVAACNRARASPLPVRWRRETHAGRRTPVPRSERLPEPGTR